MGIRVLFADHTDTPHIMKVEILTLFPAICDGVLGSSILGRARSKGLVDASAVDLRRWALGKHRQADDIPYGGGPGMVMKIEPVDRAIAELRCPGSRVILMSPQGRVFDQKTARMLAGEKHLILVCGHYEGVDQRVADHLVDDELSIGDYVLTNGALAALVVTDAVARLVPGVLGDDESAQQDSFSQSMLDHPHYTRPAEYRGWRVPEVLLSGNHHAIETWRQSEAFRRTARVRPDLLGGSSEK